jgi:hypothetical protein
LNIDADVIENAKTYAKKSGKSVSKIVEEFLSLISKGSKRKPANSLGPITRELAGIIKTKKKINYKDVLTDALLEKYS